MAANRAFVKAKGRRILLKSPARRHKGSFGNRTAPIFAIMKRNGKMRLSVDVSKKAKSGKERSMMHPLYSAILLVFLGFAVASSARADAGWTDLGPVLELTPGIHGRYVVKIGVAQNQSGCREKQMFYQDYSDRGADQMYRALLEAISAGKQVRVYVTGGCELNGHSQISSVTVVK
jgi:hypothetical protein